MNSEIFVIDTNVLLSDGQFFKKMRDCKVVVPLVVVEELDKYKTAPGDLGANARASIRYLEDTMQYGDLTVGAVSPDHVTIQIKLVDFIPDEKPDDTIIRVALSIKKHKVTIISNDAHLRIQAHIAGVIAVKHSRDLFTRADEGYLGIYTLEVAPQIINKMYSQGYIELPELDDIPINAFALLRSIDNEKQTGVVRVVSKGKGEKISTHKDVFGIKARNLEQSCATELLLDNDVPLVTLVGSAGSGKTLLALAAGLELVMTRKEYKKLIIIKPPIPMGRDIGYLPGSKEEKVMVWAGSIMDNLEVLIQNSAKFNLQHLMESEILEIDPPTFIRGRSLNDVVILVDEAQSLTLHEVKTIVTRVGENSKIILTGDIHQIDNPKVSAEDNGLTILVEAFKPYGLAGHITLNKCERSGLASLAAEIL